jgi:ferredoxin-thioredoxin reductase catalytic chain
MPQPSPKNFERMSRFAAKYAAKSGTSLHPDPAITEAVVSGLALHQDTLGRPLCPCRFYVDKRAELEAGTWICACDDMTHYKYCHCLLFVRPDGLPITEYLPEGHEGLETYGLTADPDPSKGREAAGG